MIDLLNVCSNRTPLNNRGQESIQKQFAVYDSDTTMTLKQGHQTWYELAEPEQGINHAKFKRPPLNSVSNKANVKVTVKSENTSIISNKYVQK